MKSLAKKKIIINQPYFLGDILFVMALIQKLVDTGYDVTFPVKNEYYDLQKNFPTVKMVPLTEFIQYEIYNTATPIMETDTHIAISLRHSFIQGKGHMKYKYDIMELPLETWRDIKIERDYIKENELFAKLGLKDGDKYNLVNEFHRPFLHHTPIKIESEYKNVNMSKLEGYNMLDWIGVMERAQSIHTIATSIIFLMDSIDTMPEKMHLYRRYRGEEHNGGYWDHSDYDYLLTKNYVYH